MAEAAREGTVAHFGMMGLRLESGTVQIAAGTAAAAAGVLAVTADAPTVGTTLLAGGSVAIVNGAMARSEGMGHGIVGVFHGAFYLATHAREVAAEGCRTVREIREATSEAAQVLVMVGRAAQTCLNWLANK